MIEAPSATSATPTHCQLSPIVEMESVLTSSSANGLLLLTCLTQARVHRLHLQAYRTAYLRHRPKTDCIWLAPELFADVVPEGDSHVVLRSGGAGLLGAIELVTAIQRLSVAKLGGHRSEASPAHVFVQSTHPANSVLIRRLRRLLGRVEVYYYLHEPGSVGLKIDRGDGIVSAIGVTAAHYVDLLASDRFYVSNAAARERALASYRIPSLAKKCDVLALPFVDLVPCWRPTRRPEAPHLLMIGRADDRRCLDVFLALARLAAQVRPAWRFTILSASLVEIGSTFLPNLQLTAGTPYSDEQMTAAVRSASHVFNLFRITYTQSGVTPVSLMHGIPVIASAWERDSELEKLGCIYLDAIPEPATLLTRIETAPRANCSGIREYYLRHHDADHLHLPYSVVSV